MYNERYTPLYTGEPLHLKPAESHVITFDGSRLSDADRLFFTGETALFYQWKDEPDYPMLYRHIDDALSAEQAWRCRYALDFSGENYPYPKVAYRKLPFPPILSYLPLVNMTNNWTFGLSVKAHDVTVHDGGYLRFVLEVRYRRDGVDPNNAFTEPDETFVIPLPTGSYDWQVLSLPVTFDSARTANVCVLLEGEGYSGKVWCEAPALLSENGFNLLPDFAPNAGERPQFNWLGQNLSRKEWPQFCITLNDTVLHNGELFERCHRCSETELVIPRDCIRDGENTLTFTLTSDYREALPYDLCEVGLVSHDQSFLVAVPEVAQVGEPFAVIVRTAQDDVTFTLTADAVTAAPLRFEKAGLHAIRLQCDVAGTNVPFTLALGNQSETAILSRVVEHTPDGVCVGSSDLMYIHQDDRAFEDFLCWWHENRVGNLLTLRQSYRWNGTRFLNQSLWEKTAAFLNEAGMAYAHMMDCRELPGCDANPDEKTLHGAGFLGRQNHERDGAVSYWGTRDLTDDPAEQQYWELLARMYRRHPENVGVDAYPENQVFSGGRHRLFRDGTVPADMEAAATHAVNWLASARHRAVRHTGPSTLFKYFYQAGYRFTGAELMYGPHELTIAAMRGAASVYGGNTGAHLAVQWSTTPHDTEGRYRRFRLALYSSYLQGVDEINLEEGMWRLEEYYQHFHRFSDACRNHTRQQQDMVRFAATHSRTGTFHTPIAFVSGRYDGWRCFGRGPLWGRPEFAFGEPEAAWDILKHFYPKSVLDGLYIHGCKDEPMGFYSGTPHGNVDIVPMEADAFDRYRLLVLCGYNKATEEDLYKLESYLRGGGTVLMGWPQLSVTTWREDVVEYRHTYLTHPLRDTICNEPHFVPDTFRGLPLTVSAHDCPYEAVVTTDGGHPLIYRVPLGDGNLYFVNAKDYAGNPAVAQAMEQVLSQLTETVLAKEPVYARGNESVQFAAYRQENGDTHLYFLATDWYNFDAAPRTAQLVLNGTTYAVDVPFGQLVKAVSDGTVAIWPQQDDGEVLAVTPAAARVQGVGVIPFVIAKDGTTRTVTVDFTADPIQTLSL